MAAPNGTVWGSIVGDYGRIGIYVTTSSTNTETTVTVQVWFWSKYSVDDNVGATLYLDNLSASGSATTSKGSTSVKTTVDTGEGWSTSNQILVTGKSYTYKHTRGTSAATRYIYAKLTNIDRVGGTMYANTTVSVPKLTSYTVAYNANGGSGAPSSQTKWYGKSLTLSSTKPTRIGYSFQGWALTKADADAGTWYYQPGGSCGRNENLTLHAVWKADTYSVKYDVNGGVTSSAPANQTKTHGVTLKLSNTIPKRTNYNFLGWATSETATTATYKAGANYTANSGVILYAVWELAYVKPRITVNVLSRCDENGDISDTGTGARFDLTIECDKPIVSAIISFESETTGAVSKELPFDGMQGVTAEIVTLTDVTLSTEVTYTVNITVTDELGYNTEILTLPGTKFIMDILAGGNGIAFNKPAETTLEGVMDIGFQTRLFGGIMYVLLPPKTNLDDRRTPGFYVGENISTYNYTCGDTPFPLTSGTFTLEVLSMGDNGQVLQRITSCDRSNGRAFERIWYSSAGWSEWVCVSDYAGKLLWSGAWYMTAGHTAPLAEPVSKQRSGIVLVFSLYDDTDKVEKNQEFFEFFIPKYTINAHNGSGRNFNLCGMFGNGVKYLYLHDDQIVGHDKNNANMTIGGITYTNYRYVLRYVIGV